MTNCQTCGISPDLVTLTNQSPRLLLNVRQKNCEKMRQLQCLNTHNFRFRSSPQSILVLFFRSSNERWRSNLLLQHCTSIISGSVKTFVNGKCFETTPRSGALWHNISFIYWDRTSTTRLHFGSWQCRIKDPAWKRKRRTDKFEVAADRTRLNSGKVVEGSNAGPILRQGKQIYETNIEIFARRISQNWKEKLTPLNYKSAVTTSMS